MWFFSILTAYTADRLYDSLFCKLYSAYKKEWSR